MLQNMILNRATRSYWNEKRQKRFSSPELKAQVSFSEHLSSVCSSVTFHILNFFSRTAGPISTKLGTKYPWVKGIQVCLNEGLVLFHEELITK